jgi:hypothetical protein
MTPIQTHEAELCTLMERAGLVPQEPSERYLDGHSDTATVSVHLYRGGTIAFTVDAPHYSAEHPDPRVALRHCLEMSGLLTDRPPQTDAELVQWLTERWGEPRREGSDMMESTTDRWSFHGVEYRHHAPRHLRWSDGRSLMGADAFGAMLWCAERFPEVTE